MKRYDNLLLLGLTSLLAPLGAFAQVAPADQGTINGRGGHALARRETARPLRLTVSPKGHSPIAMTTLPNAVCSLHPEGDTTQSLKLFADEDGIVHFGAGGSEEANFATAFALDCEADGVAQTFPLEVRPNSVPTTDMPAPAEEVRKVRPGAFVQPALTEFEATALSAEELATRGYPRRPDLKDSKGHASWLRAVTQPMTFGPPRPVANPGITHALTCCNLSPTSPNWSGFQLEGPRDQSSRFAFVTGTWIVPKVTGRAPLTVFGPEAYSSFWVGLDGANLVDLVQAGTEQNAITRGHVTVETCNAWVEFLPHDPAEIVLPGFPVSEGDEIICSVWIGPLDPTQPPSLAGFYAMFSVYNLRTGLYTLGSEDRRFYDANGVIQTTKVPGFEAEWIMERPTLSNGYHDLADFGQTAMWGAYATTDVTPLFFLNQPPQLPTTVYANSSNTLQISMVSAAGSTLAHPASALIPGTFCAPSNGSIVSGPCIRPDEVLFIWDRLN